MDTEKKFMNFENLNRLIEEHKKETHPYKRYEFDSTSYTLLLIDINNLLKENQKLKMINKEYERLNKEKNRGFKITNVQEYNIDELLSYKKYKDNWNKLKEYCKENTLCYEVGDDENTKLIGSKIHGLNVLDKMQELEQGSDSDVED